MIHPADMSHWERIGCRRGHASHQTRVLSMALGGPTPYHDLPAIPLRLARAFDIVVYDPDVYPVDNGPYCAGHDCLSSTLVSHGVWEPGETTLVLSVLDGRAGSHIIDFGSHIGWFSLLAASCGVQVEAIDADAENLRLLVASARRNGWESRIEARELRVDQATETFSVNEPLRLVKIDVEGAEDHVIRVLWPALQAGLVDHLLIEISPVFANYYPDLVADVVGAGFEVYRVPPKQMPPVRMEDPVTDMAALRIDTLGEAGLRALVASWHQENLWFKRAGAEW